MPSKQTFFVEGMHCASCVFYLEEKLRGQAGVTTAKANLSLGTVTVFGELDSDPITLADKLTAPVLGNGYRLVLEHTDGKKNYREFLIAVPAAVSVIIGFLLLQQLGFVSLLRSDNVSYGTAILIGLVASVSTCLAVVGGLVLSLSANAAKNQKPWRSQAIFHIGRLGGFFVLGGVIGSAGKLLQVSVMGSVILATMVALVMLILGLNLLDTIPVLKRLQLKLPRVFTRYTVLASTSSHVLAPLIVGIGTFFLPCGFTQSMQIYTLTTGNFISGGFTMLAFALGTFPVLALLSFGVLKVSNKPWKGVFFKTTGIIVIVLALLSIWNGLHLLNLL